MTEQEWLTSDDPARMLQWVNRGHGAQTPGKDISDRNLRLYHSALIEHLDMNTVAIERANLSPSTAALAAALLRDIVGNPWKPQGDWSPEPAFAKANGFERLPPKWLQPILRWNDGTIPKIAQAIYDARAFDQLPILADALEDAGCDDAAILEHCRGYELCPGCASGKGCDPGDWPDCDGSGWMPLRNPHVRGCWVLDLLLGKS